LPEETSKGAHHVIGIKKYQLKEMERKKRIGFIVLLVLASLTMGIFLGLNIQHFVTYNRWQLPAQILSILNSTGVSRIINLWEENGEREPLTS